MTDPITAVAAAVRSGFDLAAVYRRDPALDRPAYREHLVRVLAAARGHVARLEAAQARRPLHVGEAGQLARARAIVEGTEGTIRGLDAG